MRRAADGARLRTVFKGDRGAAGEKIAYVRMFSGVVRTRDWLLFGRQNEGKVTAVGVFDRGSAVQSASVAAGQIGKLWGLGDVQIGDAIGMPRTGSEGHYMSSSSGLAMNGRRRGSLVQPNSRPATLRNAVTFGRSVGAPFRRDDP